jgi:ABC-type bacteriocin/lantibiotic exporter with double-glycine peptidase domain
MYLHIVDLAATTAARIEEASYPHAVILPNFPRGIKLDYQSCGVHCVLSILRFYKKRVSFNRLERLLRTDEYGTAVSDINRVIKRFGLESRTIRKPSLRNLKNAIDEGYPVLISTWNDLHYEVVFGYSDSHIFVSNPSIDVTSDGVGRLSCAVPTREFRRAWDRWALEVRKTAR